MRREHGTDVRRQQIARLHCANNIIDWFNDWVWTYDPRNAATGDPSTIPFDLFPRQVEYLLWAQQRVAERQEFLVEKSRDVGMSWLNCGLAIHYWLFRPGFKTTMGSSKEDKVDKRGDPDSLFEKMRMLLWMLPQWQLPVRFSSKAHDNFMRLINPDNGNAITGEVGHNMGRGGRSTLYFIDEAAHIDQAERVDAATLANADSRAWVSSVNGMGNVFARKAVNSYIPKFRFHYTDDPRKSEQWATDKKRVVDPVIWASEYEIDYAASIEGICIPGKFVTAAQALRHMADIEPSAYATAGLDIGAGKARSVFIRRAGPIVDEPIDWGDPDTLATAYKAIELCSNVRSLAFDVVGVGHGAGTIFRSANREAESRQDDSCRFRGLNTGTTPSSMVWPDGRSSVEMFLNRKAELWWLARTMLQRSYEYWLFLKGEDGGQDHAPEDLLILPENPTLATQLSVVRWFRNEKGKIQMESKQQLARRGIRSPDFADALILAIGAPILYPMGSVDSMFVGMLESASEDWP